jgi:hypothetical protein
MSFLSAFGPKQEVAQNIHVGHPAGYHPNLADLFRLRQMEKIIQQTAEELEQLKARLDRLEEALAPRNQPGTVACPPDDQPDAAQPPLPLPITELKQLAEMAKRFR